MHSLEEIVVVVVVVVGVVVMLIGAVVVLGVEQQQWRRVLVGSECNGFEFKCGKRRMSMLVLMFGHTATVVQVEEPRDICNFNYSKQLSSFMGGITKIWTRISQYKTF